MMGKKLTYCNSQIQRLGHEFVGTVVAVPPSETKWKVGGK